MISLPILVMWPVKSSNVKFLLADDVVVSADNSSNWTHHARVSRQETQECGGLGNDQPWVGYKAEDSHQEGGATNVDVVRCQGSNICGEAVYT